MKTMSHKYQYGKSLYDIILYGLTFQTIIADIKGLHVPIDQALMLHNLYEKFPSNDKKEVKEQIANNVSHLKTLLTPRVADINRIITLTNKAIKELDFVEQIPKLETKKILQLVKGRLQTLHEVEDTQKISNSYFLSQLDQMLKKPVMAILEFNKRVEQEEYTEEVGKLDEQYESGIRQALNICSIGYYSTAVFIAGRTVEELINHYLSILFKTKKIKRVNLTKTKFDTKINMLHGAKYINNELYHRLLSIKIYRNKFAHPSTKLLTKHQAHLKILSIIDLIPEVEKMTKTLERRL